MTFFYALKKWSKMDSILKTQNLTFENSTYQDGKKMEVTLKKGCQKHVQNGSKKGSKISQKCAKSVIFASSTCSTCSTCHMFDMFGHSPKVRQT